MSVLEKPGVRFVAGFLILWGVLHGTSLLLPDTLAGGAVLAVTLGSALLVERRFFGVRPRQALCDLGFGRPTGSSLAPAVAVSGLIVLVYALYAAFGGAGLGLKAYWPLHLVGLFLFNGLAEELVWRGYLYRRLRATRSFRGAILASMPLMAMTHVYIAVDNGAFVAVLALVVAAVTCLPLSYLFERGANTIWAAAIVHTAIDLFRIFEIPDAERATFSALISLAAFVLPFGVFLFRDRGPKRAGAVGEAQVFQQHSPA